MPLASIYAAIERLAQVGTGFFIFYDIGNGTGRKQFARIIKCTTDRSKIQRTVFVDTERECFEPRCDCRRVGNALQFGSVGIQDTNFGVTIDYDVQPIVAVNRDVPNGSQSHERLTPHTGTSKAVYTAVGGIGDKDVSATISGHGNRRPRIR
jgi:hypothetical protein